MLELLSGDVNEKLLDDEAVITMLSVSADLGCVRLIAVHTTRVVVVGWVFVDPGACGNDSVRADCVTCCPSKLDSRVGLWLWLWFVVCGLWFVVCSLWFVGCGLVWYWFPSWWWDGGG